MDDSSEEEDCMEPIAVQRFRQEGHWAGRDGPWNARTVGLKRGLVEEHGRWEEVRDAKRYLSDKLANQLDSMRIVDSFRNSVRGEAGNNLAPRNGMTESRSENVSIEKPIAEDLPMEEAGSKSTAIIVYRPVQLQVAHSLVENVRQETSLQRQMLFGEADRFQIIPYEKPPSSNALHDQTAQVSARGDMMTI